MKLDKKIVLTLILGGVLSGCMHLGVLPGGQSGVQTSGVEKTGSQVVGAQDYTKAAYDEARAEGRVILVYFEANWCPICRKQRPVNEEAFKALADDENLVIFVSNFKDSEETIDDKELQATFNVPYQHTFVIVDAAGDVVYQHTGELTKNEIVDKVREASL